MNQVEFSDQSLYQYVKTLAGQSWRGILQAKFNDENLTVEVDKAELAPLLYRLNKHAPAVLPYVDKNQCYWVVTAQDDRNLDKTIRRLGYFVFPSYAEILDPGGIPKRRHFEPKKGGFNHLGQQLFPQGFYLFRSPQSQITKILEILGLWIGLDDSKPTRSKKERPSYFELYQDFKTKLDEKNWTDAQRDLDTIRRLSLSTAENISFLRIQLWGMQGDWKRIWGLADYVELSKLPIPRNVRAFMLSAFYWQVLQAREADKNIEAVFQAFDDYRSKLGRLLTGRFDLQETEVLRVFMYLAVKDQNRDGFEELRGAAKTADLQGLIASLENRLPAKIRVSTDADPGLLARQALAANDFDGAVRVAERIADPLDQTFLYMQIAVLSGDKSSETINLALHSHDTLSEAQKGKLLARYPQTTLHLQFLEALVNQPELLSAWEPEVSTLRLRAWQLIAEFEIRLRKLIENRYCKNLGQEWWSRIDPEFLERWQKASNDRLDFRTAPAILDYSYLSDLDKLTRRQWEFFQDALGSSKQDRAFFKRGMEKTITTRNILAHNRAAKIDDLKTVIEFGYKLIKKMDGMLVSLT
jgi:hypothetical protein